MEIEGRAWGAIMKSLCIVIKILNPVKYTITRSFGEPLCYAFIIHKYIIVIHYINILKLILINTLTR